MSSRAGRVGGACNLWLSCRLLYAFATTSISALGPCGVTTVLFVREAAAGASEVCVVASLAIIVSVDKAATETLC